MSEQIKTVTASPNGNGTTPDVTQLKELIESMELSRSQKNGMINDIYTRVAATLASEPGSEPAPAFKPLTLRELTTRPPKDWLIENLIGRQDMAMIFGDAGSGKTFVTIDLIFAAITGQPFATQFTVPRPLRVAYCAGEGLGGLPGRFLAAGNHYQVWDTPAEANLFPFVDAPQLYEADVDLTIHRFIDDWKEAGRGSLDLLVIDTLHSATFGADENNAKDAGVILRAAKYARDSLGCTLLFDHHANRAGGYRGSSAFHGSMDTMLQTYIDAEGRIGKVECFKQKDAERFLTLYFRLAGEQASQSARVKWLDRETVQFNDEKPTKKEAIKSEILMLLRSTPAGLNQSEIVKQLTDAGRKTILAALNDLESAGMVLVGTGDRGAKIYQLRLDE